MARYIVSVVAAEKYGWMRAATAGEVLGYLGLRSAPVEGMPETLVQGVRVYIRPLAAPALIVRGGRSWLPSRNWQGLRVRAVCSCGRDLAVGRLRQHVCKGGL